MSKTGLAFLIAVVVVCLAAGYFIAGVSAADVKPVYENLEKELPSGTTLKTATIVQLGDAFRVSLRKHPDDAVPLLRVCVLLRCRRYAVADSDVPNSPSSVPRADILHLLRIALHDRPDLGASFISDAIGSCGDAAQAASKVVLTESPADDSPEYPGLTSTQFNPPPAIFTPVTPSQDGKR